jgi:serine/threonine protein kinase
VLVVKPRPAWWVKIADFGISKRVEEATALRTMYIGTQGYMAPEIMGIFHPDDDDDIDHEDITYDEKVDMWALGEMVFRMLTCRPGFANVRQLHKYVVRGAEFPLQPLREKGASIVCCKFIQAAMAPRPKARMSAAEGKYKPWMDSNVITAMDNLSFSNQPFDSQRYAIPETKDSSEIVEAHSIPKPGDLNPRYRPPRWRRSVKRLDEC